MNPTIEAWLVFWKWVLIIGLSFYFVVAVIVVPFGLLDIRRLFRRLDDISAEHQRNKQQKN